MMIYFALLLLVFSINFRLFILCISSFLTSYDSFDQMITITFPFWFLFDDLYLFFLFHQFVRW